MVQFSRPQAHTFGKRKKELEIWKPKKRKVDTAGYFVSSVSFFFMAVNYFTWPTFLCLRAARTSVAELLAHVDVNSVCVLHMKSKSHTHSHEHISALSWKVLHQLVANDIRHCHCAEYTKCSAFAYLSPRQALHVQAFFWAVHLAHFLHTPRPHSTHSSRRLNSRENPSPHRTQIRSPS